MRQLRAAAGVVAGGRSCSSKPLTDVLQRQAERGGQEHVNRPGVVDKQDLRHHVPA